MEHAPVRLLCRKDEGGAVVFALAARRLAARADVDVDEREAEERSVDDGEVRGGVAGRSHRVARLRVRVGMGFVDTGQARDGVRLVVVVVAASAASEHQTQESHPRASTTKHGSEGTTLGTRFWRYLE